MRDGGYGRVSTDHEEQRDSLEHQQAFFQDFARARGHPGPGLCRPGDLRQVAEKAGRLPPNAPGRGAGEFELVVVRTSPASPGTPWTPGEHPQAEGPGHRVHLCQQLPQGAGGIGIHRHHHGGHRPGGERQPVQAGEVREGHHLPEGGCPPASTATTGWTTSPSGSSRRRRRWCGRSSASTSRAWAAGRSPRLWRSGGRPPNWGQLEQPRGAPRPENPIYCGHYVNHKYTVSDFLSGQIQRLPPDMHYHHDRPEWAIVSPDTFQEAARLMEQRRRKSGSALPPDTAAATPLHPHPLPELRPHPSPAAGWPTSGRQYVYWHCPIHSEYAGSRCGNGTILPEEGLLDQPGPGWRPRSPPRRAGGGGTPPAGRPLLPACGGPLPPLSGAVWTSWRASVPAIWSSTPAICSPWRNCAGGCGSWRSRSARLREDLDRLTRDPPRDLEAEITEQVRRVLSWRTSPTGSCGS